MDEGNFNIQKTRKHLENLEIELTMLKNLLFSSEETQKRKSKKRIKNLREQLMNEGFDEELVQLVGTVPKYQDSYKEEIRTVIYERF